MEGRELPNQEKKSERLEKKKPTIILEADIINQAEMNEKIKKITSRERENYSIPNYMAEISTKR